jgi:curved DNA-binding protein CbpA
MSFDPVAYARSLFPQLDQRSYYDLLGVPAHADHTTVRAAYYRVAAVLHPDRHHTLPDAQAKEQLEIIYARMTEAYRVLTSPEKRAVYDRALAEGKTRFDGRERERSGPKNPEDSLTHPEAKKFFRLAVMCAGRKDWKGAIMNLNFARTFEPGAAVLAEKLAEAQAAAKGAPPPR